MQENCEILTNIILKRIYGEQISIIKVSLVDGQRTNDYDERFLAKHQTQ